MRIYFLKSPEPSKSLDTFGSALLLCLFATNLRVCDWSMRFMQLGGQNLLDFYILQNSAAGFLRFRINFGMLSAQVLVNKLDLTLAFETVSTPLGNLTMLKEKILSIPSHCSNVHSFPGNKEHLACSHGPLGDRTKSWLKPDSKVFYFIALCPFQYFRIFIIVHIVDINFIFQ